MMPRKYFKKYPTSLAIREMKIKSTLRSDLILVRMGRIKKTADDEGQQRHGGRGLLITVGRTANWVVTLQISMENPQKAKSRFTI